MIQAWDTWDDILFPWRDFITVYFYFRENVGIFIFEMEVGRKRVPYSVVDTFFEALLADTRNMAHLPLRLYSGEDCYDFDMQVPATEVIFVIS